MAEDTPAPEVETNSRVSKRKLIAAVAKRAGVSVQVASRVYEALLEELVVIVSSGRKVMLTGFGSFYRQLHKGHKVQFSPDGQSQQISDYGVMKFSATRSTNQRMEAEQDSER